jgi:arylformamidase
MRTAFRLVDLSHTIVEGATTYPGLPAPVITPHLTREASRAVYAAGTEFRMDVISMIGNTGTYIDAPFHRYEGGADLSQLRLDTLVDLETVVVRHDPEQGRGVRADQVESLDVTGRAVLIATGWDVHFGSAAYGIGAPYLSAAAATQLADAGAVLVGIDSVNIDDTESGGERPAHSILLARGVHVVEHLAGLTSLPATGALFTAVPPKVRGFSTFPVRAFAKVPA